MADEKLVSLMSEARLVAASDNVIFPLIKKKIEDRINLACGRFLNGETTFISDIAYIQALKEVYQELNAKIEAGNKAIKELNERD